MSESIRYLDIHDVLPEDSPPELKAGYDALLGPLLLNSSLAAIKAQKSTANALIAVGNTTRALDNLELNGADKGAFHCLSSNDLSMTFMTFAAAKALYRRAIAYIYMKEEDKAESDLAQAAELIPTDTAIASELEGIRRRRKELREKEKRAYKKMFG